MKARATISTCARGRAPCLQPASGQLTLRTYERNGPAGDPDDAPIQGPSAGGTPMSSWWLAETGESGGCSTKRDHRSEIRAAAPSTTTTVAQCQDGVEEFTSRYARTDETQDEAAFNEVPEARRAHGAGDRGGNRSSISAQSIRRPMGEKRLQGPDGRRVPVHMGSNGIGVSTAHGRDHRGLPMTRRASSGPEGVTPFHVGIVQPQAGATARQMRPASGFYGELNRAGARAALRRPGQRAGAKFATMDLIGLPWRITGGSAGPQGRVGRGDRPA